MFGLLLEVTAIFLVLFIIVPILFMSIFMHHITHEDDGRISWRKDDDAEPVNH